MKDDAYSIAEQFRRPHGIKGRFVAKMMRLYNGDAINWTIDCLNLQENDSILVFRKKQLR